MCGIAGIFGFHNKKISKDCLRRMSEVLMHRGPDDHGEYFEENIGFANRRLSIIDLSKAGKQPMSTGDKLLWITYNGEIFNYRELKEDLIRKGYRFRSQTDTEVLLYGYRQYGTSFVNRLIGQFAFCIWDKRKKLLFLARDHIGINPLFYAKTGDFFLFASETKSIIASGLVKKTIDRQALHHYLSVFCILAPHTIFQNIKSLLPGHIMIVNESGIKIRKYYDLPNKPESYVKNNFSEIKAKLIDLLVSAVKYANVADVPVGAFLSGGIDSSTIVSILSQQSSKPIHTFSLWAKGKNDERKYARIISKQYQTIHQEFTVTENEVIKEIPKVVYYFDQPTGGSMENYFICKKAKGSVKVALSGLGGDELFAGYHGDLYNIQFLKKIYNFIPAFLRNSIMGLFLNLPISFSTKKVAKIINHFLNLPTILDQYLFLYFAYQEKEKRKLYNKSYMSSFNGKMHSTEDILEKLFYSIKSSYPQERFRYLDLTTYTRDDLLLGTNMMSMAHSIEVRVPFLDQRLIQYVSQIHPIYHFQKGTSKYLLKQLISEWLPSEIIKHKKTGLGLPRNLYMKGKLKPHILSVLSSNSMKKRGIFNPYYVKELTDSFYSDNSEKMLWSEHLRIWILFIFELWCRIYLDRPSISIPEYSLSDLS